MQFRSWEKTIKEPNGKMIYIYYPEWMDERVIGAKDYISWDRGKAPWYELNSKGELVYKGLFKDRILTYAFMFISYIDKYRWVGNLPKYNQSHVDLTAKIFAKMKSEYLKKFPNGKFSVVVMTFYDTPLDDLVKAIKKNNVDAVPIQKHINYKSGLFFMDMHLNEKGHQFIADTLSESIKF